ncbi:MAG: hypothetical protein IJ323_02430 [Clostridia bacterium]|nr:hypothetical protein [Clostridia bacterium]
MLKTNSCTTGATQSPGSILSTLVSSTCTQNDITDVILPYADLLPTGMYISKIVSVSEGVYDSKPYIDCIHQLTDVNGDTKIVKFRYFAPTETTALRKKMAEYKFEGSMAEALDALEESVTISHRPGSAKYVYISARALATSTVSSSPPTNKPSSLGGRIYLSSKANRPAKLSTKASLLEADEDDEDDLLLDEDEE